MGISRIFRIYQTLPDLASRSNATNFDCFGMFLYVFILCCTFAGQWFISTSLVVLNCLWSSLSLLGATLNSTMNCPRTRVWKLHWERSKQTAKAMAWYPFNIAFNCERPMQGLPGGHGSFEQWREAAVVTVVYEVSNAGHVWPFIESWLWW